MFISLVTKLYTYTHITSDSQNDEQTQRRYKVSKLLFKNLKSGMKWVNIDRREISIYF